MVNPEQAVIQVNKILGLFREQNWPIYHVRHISIKSRAVFIIPDTAGADFYKDCSP